MDSPRTPPRLRRLLYLPVGLGCRAADLAARVCWRVVPGLRRPLMEMGGDRATVVFGHLLHDGVPPRLDAPRTYTEKLSWLKLNHHNPLVRLCSDKIAVRGYLEHCGLAHLAAPLLGTYRRAEDLDPSSLPRAFVAKTNHGSGFVTVCRDGDTLDRPRFERRFNTWLGHDFSRWYAETNYRGIEPRIMVEELVADPRDIVECKVFCFHGEPRFLSVIGERRGGTPVRGIYDPQWQRQDYGSRGLLSEGGVRPRPPFLDELLDHAARLSRDFLHVRVDFMAAGGRLWFSELTFYNLGGFTPLEPAAMNRVVGSWLDLEREAEVATRGCGLAAALGPSRRTTAT